MMTLGSVLVLVAGVGLLRLPDLYMRMSATTKAATLGLGLILIGVAMVQGTWAVTWRVAATILFLALTAPIAAHAIGQAAYFAGVPLWHGTRVDELGRRLESDAAVAPEPSIGRNFPVRAGN
jgi:multicomponent Na+:H+ antiporter subunit G